MKIQKEFQLLSTINLWWCYFLDCLQILSLLALQLMFDTVEVGEELMPHRNQEDITNHSQTDKTLEETQTRGTLTPIRKLSRNRGLVLQEQSVVADSPESDDSAARRAAAIRKGKRKLL